MNEENYMCYMPVSVLLDKSLPSGAKVMFLLISSLTRREGYCCASNRYFMEALDASEKTVKRWLAVLKEEDLINVETISRTGDEGEVKERRIFPLNYPARDKNVQQRTKMSSGGQKCPAEDKNDPSPHDVVNTKITMDSNSNINILESSSLRLKDKNTDKNKNTDLSNKKESKERSENEPQDDVDTMFNRFWKEYPKKRDKKGSYRAFRNIKKLKTEFPNIILGLERDRSSAQWNKDGGQFIPNPTTWLHQERWKDSMSDERKGTWVGDLFVTDF